MDQPAQPQAFIGRTFRLTVTTLGVPAGTCGMLVYLRQDGGRPQVRFSVQRDGGIRSSLLGLPWGWLQIVE